MATAQNVSSGGDDPSASSPSTGESSAVWLLVSYDELTIVSRVVMYETYEALFLTSFQSAKAAGISTTFFPETESTSWDWTRIFFVQVLPALLSIFVCSGCGALPVCLTGCKRRHRTASKVRLHAD